MMTNLRSTYGLLSGKISVIRLPDFVTKADFDWAVEEAARKKKTDFSKAEFLTYDEVCAFNACM